MSMHVKSIKCESFASAIEQILTQVSTSVIGRGNCKTNTCEQALRKLYVLHLFI